MLCIDENLEGKLEGNKNLKTSDEIKIYKTSDEIIKKEKQIKTGNNIYLYIYKVK